MRLSKKASLLIILIVLSVILCGQSIKFDGELQIHTIYEIDFAIVSVNAYKPDTWWLWETVDYVEFENEVIHYSNTFNHAVIMVTTYLWVGDRVIDKEIIFQSNKDEYIIRNKNRTRVWY